MAVAPLVTRHPLLTVHLYYDAISARAHGDEVSAWAMEDEAFTKEHLTDVDFVYRGWARLRHGDWRGWLDGEHRWGNPLHRIKNARPFMRTHEPWHRFATDGHGEWVEREGWETELRELTILVGMEAGAGDMIMLLRFLSWVASRAKRVYWLVPRDLKRMADWFIGDIVGVVTEEPLPSFDRWIMMESLPAIDGAIVPWHEGYRGCVKARMIDGGLGRMPELPPSGRATGLCWSGNPAFDNNARRSMDHESSIRFLLAINETIRDPAHEALVSYQRGDAADVWPSVARDWERTTGDWHSTYQSLATECARVITVDTGLAHLAGAMGMPTYCLVAYDHDFRWQHVVDGCSAWYPSFRVIKQQRPGDWSCPIAEVVRQLKTEGR